MKQFRATVRASGMVVATVIFANSSIEAQKILQALFGVANIISLPQQIGR